MVPAVFVLLEALPLMPNGRSTAGRCRRPTDHDRTGQGVRSARTPTEELLAEIWAQLLDLERVGIHDNFFDLGGHSLLATQLVSRMRETFQVEFRCAICSRCRPWLVWRKALRPPSGRPNLLAHHPAVPRNGDLALSFAQQRLWFFDQLEPGSRLQYSSRRPPQGTLNLAALEQSLNEIVKRHESLRTTFGSGGRPTQVIART